MYHPGRNPETWQAVENQQREDVLAAVEAFVRRNALTARQRGILERAVKEVHRLLDRDPWPACLSLPLLVHAGICGDAAAAVPLAAATSLLNAARHILDDFADGDLSEEWKTRSPTEVTVGVALTCIVVQLAIVQLDARPDVRDVMQETLARGLLEMADGQLADISAIDRMDVTASEVQAAVAAKTGAGYAMYAALAAQLAGASAERAAAYAAMGRALGTAVQLASDCDDLIQPGLSRDLTSGIRTLPIVMCLERFTGPERDGFASLLLRARREPGAQEEVRQRLRDAGIFHLMLFLIKTHCRQALRALEETGACEPARSRLQALIESVC